MQIETRMDGTIFKPDEVAPMVLPHKVPSLKPHVILLWAPTLLHWLHPSSPKLCENEVFIPFWHDIYLLLPSSTQNI